MKFKKYDKIKTQGKKYQCICSDNDTAVFAPVKGTKVKYKKMFAVTNYEIDDGFIYKRVKKKR